MGFGLGVFNFLESVIIGVLYSRSIWERIKIKKCDKYFDIIKREIKIKCKNLYKYINDIIILYENALDLHA